MQPRPHPRYTQVSSVPLIALTTFPYLPVFPPHSPASLPLPLHTLSHTLSVCLSVSLAHTQMYVPEGRDFVFLIHGLEENLANNRHLKLFFE